MKSPVILYGTPWFAVSSAKARLWAAIGKTESMTLRFGKRDQVEDGHVEGAG